ncbi:MAG: TonB-dependent receptor [Bryobacterales bacterium]|nr:TonB-dependent receptor [Bryobacterales bacterium]
MLWNSYARCLLLTALLALLAPTARGQQSGQISGKVSMKETGGPLHGASVLIVELGRSTLSDDDGLYEFDRVPPGNYHVVAHLEGIFTEGASLVTVAEGGTATADFFLELATVRDEITVTAGEKTETAFEAFQSVESVGALELAGTPDVSLGEMLDHRVGTGIAKRGFGPGAARPIVRGFDGDRVLIMQDGIRTGTLSSQSGDHGELINTTQLERLEIVKGPATLLYSGNAMGGTVNAVSRHHDMHSHAHQGLRGYLLGSAGTNNSLGGASAGFEYGIGKWMIWGQSGGLRSSDYTAPFQGEIYNSRSRSANGGGGFGWYGRKTFFSFEAQYAEGSYGVPFVEDFHGHHEDEHGEEHGEEDEDHEEGEEEEEEHHEEEGDEEDHGEEDEDEEHDDDEDGHEEEELDRVALDSVRTHYRFNWGLKDLGGAIDSFTLKLGYTDWKHDEVEFFHDGNSAIGTTFSQQQVVYRGVFEQGRVGKWSGRFGFWGIDRDYEAMGEEALSPPVSQSGFAVFALEEVDFEKVKFQFGGRLETQKYTPAFSERGMEEGEEHHEEEEHDEGEGEEYEVPDAIQRTLTGASVSAGLHANTWKDGALVMNYAHSYRAPALEELYNFGPHAGTLSFEIGDPRLEAETGNGVDLSLRHNAGRVRGELNLFYYDFDNFIFPFAPGAEEDGLPVIEFTQLDARFMGTEAGVDVSIHPNLWLNLGADFVDAQETVRNTPLPRIPPLRGKIGVDVDYGGFRLTPQLILASQQHQTYTREARTPGYAVVNLKASYTITRQHLVHQFAVNVFNIGDRLYRNHSSYIKDLAPEIGRGVRFTYTMRFF